MTELLIISFTLESFFGLLLSQFLIIMLLYPNVYLVTPHSTPKYRANFSKRYSFSSIFTAVERIPRDNKQGIVVA